MVFNVTFNSNSVVSWWPDLLVQETKQNNRYVESHSLTNFITSTLTGFELITLVVIDTESI
jgi:hypothetical protein